MKISGGSIAFLLFDAKDGRDGPNTHRNGLSQRLRRVTLDHLAANVIGVVHVDAAREVDAALAGVLHHARFHGASS